MGNDSINKELQFLKNRIKASEAQNRIFDLLFDINRSSAADTIMKKTMQSALNTITDFSGAANGSLFLLDDQGKVTDSLLATEDLSEKKRNKIIGSVLDKGLAGWVKTHRTVGLIKDTKKDPRWIEIANRPFDVRSALAIPIIRRGFLYGLLTLMHPQPDYFSHRIINNIQMTANQIAVALENAQLHVRQYEANQRLTHANKKIEGYSNLLKSELIKGQKIQKEFLPHKIPVIKGAEIRAFFYPALQLSGDFYDFFLLPENLLGIVIADVSDKGVGAALFMALIRSLIRVFSGHFDFYNSFQKKKQRAYSKKNMDDILFAVSLTNDYLAVEHGEEGMFATLFFGVFNPDTGEMVYTNCGHEPLFMISRKGIKTKLRPLGPALGIFPGKAYKTESVTFNSKDILLGFTDGVTEAQSPNGNFYTRKRLEKIVWEKASLDSSDTLLSAVTDDLFQHIGGASQSDDITIVTIQKH